MVYDTVEETFPLPIVWSATMDLARSCVLQKPWSVPQLGAVVSAGPVKLLQAGICGRVDPDAVAVLKA